MTPEEIKSLRKELGLTQKELGDLIGANAESVARWERGERKPLSVFLEKLKKIAGEANALVKP